MRVLGIETSAALGGFALVEDEDLRAEIVSDITGSHVERGVAMVEETLERAGWSVDDLDGVAVSIGPGSFTGLRVGLAMAKAISFGKSIPLAGVPTLDCMARQVCCWEGLIAAARDARRGEIYLSVYESEGCRLRRASAYEALAPEAAARRIDGLRSNRRVLVTGDGIARYGEILRQGLEPAVTFAPAGMWAVRPGTVAALGRNLLHEGDTIDIDTAQPLYVRASEAERQAMGMIGDDRVRNTENAGD